MEEDLHWHGRRLMEQTASAPEKNGFLAVVFDHRDQALAYLQGEADGVETIGFGDSMSLVELGLPALLENFAAWQEGRK